MPGPPILCQAPALQKRMLMDPARLTRHLKDEARRQGFELAGACPAVPPPGLDRFHAWLRAGYAGEMRYLTERAEAYAHPAAILEDARSILMLAAAYRSADPRPAAAGQGRVSRYAWGRDYHDVIHDRLRRLALALRAAVPGARVRGVVDTAPLLEREFAQLAGLGWVGKNTLLLNRELGSWFFLAALVTDQELAYDAPLAVDHCGTCRACLDACPTGALVGPYELDARRCISYLTIELRGPVDPPLRAGMDQWLFGCDVCQDVCPWNRQTPEAAETDFAPAEAMNPVDLASLFDLDDEAFRRRFRHTPLWRAKRRGLLRNAAVALGNRPVARVLDALVRGLRDPEPLVRGASAWALGRHQSPSASRALKTALQAETDAQVRLEITTALR